ncbi:hypothetical protein M0R04_09035 [Candidatus Dojkabacteria bacterium]|jgi:predicted nucleic acid-binding Zn ribbon protein|nr:hypothetical protein [Candidatus Dojkabacteria bacterium]
MGILKKSILRGLIFSFYLLLIVVAWYVSTMSAVYSHEHVHQIIFRDYGIDSYVTYNYLFPINSGNIGETVPYNYTLASERCNEICNQEHNYNEIIGYNYLSLLSAIAMFMMVVLFIWFTKHLISDSPAKQFIKIEKKYY